MNLIKDVEEVESFKFLGSTINSKRDCSQEIRRRLAIVRSVVQSLIKLWKSKLPRHSRSGYWDLLLSLWHHMVLNPEPWNLRTRKGWTLSRCGVTAGSWKYHGLQRRQMLGYWRNWVSTKHSELMILRKLLTACGKRASGKLSHSMDFHTKSPIS